jgi:hypothetical protein
LCLPAGGTGLLNNLDRYDLLKEDLEWLRAVNAAGEARRPPGHPITDAEMEAAIDVFEREAAKITLVRTQTRRERMARDGADHRKRAHAWRAASDRIEQGDRSFASLSFLSRMRFVCAHFLSLCLFLLYLSAAPSL